MKMPLRLRLPIIQAPMAGVSTPNLAAAVSNAGGLGSIGIGSSSVDGAARMIHQTQSLTDKPFNVNVFCHELARRDTDHETAWLSFLTPLFAQFEAEAPSGLSEVYPSFKTDEAALQMLLALHPEVVSFHFGLPSQDKIAALHEAGIILLATATNLAEARKIEAAGIDIVVAQGVEAGGHRGVFDLLTKDEGLSTFVLVQTLTRELRIPVVAAGGIMDGCGIRAMLALGATAAQLGTAFILCPESSASDSYRKYLLSSRASLTRITRYISGRPARGMINDFIRYCEGRDAPDPADYPVAYDAAKQLNAVAESSGSNEYAAQWAGQDAPFCRSLPAADLMNALATEFRTSASGRLQDHPPR